MSMDIGGAKGGVKADINVTPLVDVMLVLLIIMMVIAPMLQKGVAVRLPTAANSTDKPDTQDQTVVAIDVDKRVYLNTIRVPLEELGTKVRDLLEVKKDKIVLIKGDTDAPYEAIMDTMDVLRKAGVEDMGFITEPKVRPGQSGGN